MKFQSTRPRGRTRHCDFGRFQSFPGFNPRVLAGGRDYLHVLVMLGQQFQSTRPRGRTRLRRTRIPPGAPAFQSTRPRGRTRPLSCSLLSQQSVSIHASSREDATACQRSDQLSDSFNPRVLAGGRDRLAIRIFAAFISFNPRVLAGGRDDYSPEQQLSHQFQSTRPRGRTRHRNVVYCDTVQVSIHASSREDATKLAVMVLVMTLFQSTRPRGRTRPGSGKDFRYGTVSIHASSREDAARSDDSESGIYFGFNPRVLAGGRDQEIRA